MFAGKPREVRIHVINETRQFEELEVTCVSLESNPPADISLTVLGNEN